MQPDFQGFLTFEDYNKFLNSNIQCGESGAACACDFIASSSSYWPGAHGDGTSISLSRLDGPIAFRHGSLAVNSVPEISTVSDAVFG